MEAMRMLRKFAVVFAWQFASFALLACASVKISNSAIGIRFN